MDQAPYTEKVLGSTIHKGNLCELNYSLKLHSMGLPILCSSLMLRSYGLGQCDLVRYFSEIPLIEIFEVKKNKRLSRQFLNQKSRIKASGEFLSKLLNARIRFLVIYEEDFAKTDILH